MHDFKNDAIEINNFQTLIRLNMVQTLFGRDIAFSVRTFRFTGGNQTSGDQEQTISCELYLEPAADVAATQPDDCSCYTENECAEFLNIAGEQEKGSFEIRQKGENCLDR